MKCSIILIATHFVVLRNFLRDKIDPLKLKEFMKFYGIFINSNVNENDKKCYEVKNDRGMMKKFKTAHSNLKEIKIHFHQANIIKCAEIYYKLINNESAKI